MYVFHNNCPAYLYFIVRLGLFSRVLVYPQCTKSLPVLWASCFLLTEVCMYGAPLLSKVHCRSHNRCTEYSVRRISLGSIICGKAKTKMRVVMHNTSRTKLTRHDFLTSFSKFHWPGILQSAHKSQVGLLARKRSQSNTRHSSIVLRLGGTVYIPEHTNMPRPSESVITNPDTDR